jgi:hypothetical protein
MHHHGEVGDFDGAVRRQRDAPPPIPVIVPPQTRPARYCLAAIYADALSAASEFQQFELLYKVVEYFFAEDGAGLDAAVSAHVTPFDPSFDPPTMERLRQLWNRAVHPRAKKGHVKPENISHVRDVHAALPLMRRLADILLADTTF